MSVDLWGLPRQPEWRFTLLNSKDEAQGELLGVRGGRVTVATFARLGGNAELQITHQPGQVINPMTDRVRISYDPGVEGLNPVSWGVFLFTSPKDSFGVNQRSNFGMLTKMVVIDGDSYIESFSVPAGTPIIDMVVQIITSTGETKIAATPSDATLTNGLVFEAGESKLTIINTLLESAGYGALWCDGEGQFRVEPYIEPSSRPTVRTFHWGDLSLYKPDWQREQDITGVPNRVVVVCQGSEDEPSIVGHAVNNDPDSPFSIPNRAGQVITRREEVSDIASVAEADALAYRYLIGGMSPVAVIDAVHAIVPLEPGARVTLEEESGSRDVVVRQMEFDLGSPFSQCKAKWNEVTL